MKLTYVNKIGIELEGGWNKSFSYTEFKHDVSVFRDGVPSEIKVGKGGHYGEVSSDPLNMDLAVEWLKVHYPDFSDATCGMHIHTSLKRTSAYQRLAQREFFDYWHKTLWAWGEAAGVKDQEFWTRMNGDNRFCRKTFAASQQVKLARKEGDTRRTQLNYCYRMHKTLECRVFPVFKNPDHAVQALLAHVGIIEKYLRDTKGKKGSTRLILKALE